MCTESGGWKTLALLTNRRAKSASDGIFLNGDCWSNDVTASGISLTRIDLFNSVGHVLDISVSLFVLYSATSKTFFFSPNPVPYIVHPGYTTAQKVWEDQALQYRWWERGREGWDDTLSKNKGGPSQQDKPDKRRLLLSSAMKRGENLASSIHHRPKRGRGGRRKA